jgi:amino acid transporter
MIKFLEDEAKENTRKKIWILKIVISAILLLPLAFDFLNVFDKIISWKNVMDIIKYVMLILSIINLKFDILWDRIKNRMYEKTRNKKLIKFEALKIE